MRSENKNQNSPDNRRKNHRNNLSPEHTYRRDQYNAGRSNHLNRFEYGHEPQNYGHQAAFYDGHNGHMSSSMGNHQGHQGHMGHNHPGQGPHLLMDHRYTRSLGPSNMQNMNHSTHLDSDSDRDHNRDHNQGLPGQPVHRPDPTHLAYSHRATSSIHSGGLIDTEKQNLVKKYRNLEDAMATLLSAQSTLQSEIQELNNKKKSGVDTYNLILTSKHTNNRDTSKRLEGIFGG